jgi:cell division protease FtsH
VNPRNQSFVVTFLLIVAAVAMVVMAIQRETGPSDMSLSNLAAAIEQGSVNSILIDKNSLEVTFADGSEALVNKEPNINVLDQLLALNSSPEKLSAVTWDVKKVSQWERIVSGSLYILPVLFMAGVLWFIFRQSQRSTQSTSDFVKSRAGMLSSQYSTTSFADVGGSQRAKEQLKEIVDFLKEPRKFIQLGAHLPRGILLTGPTGIGKTLLAKAMAGESNVPFYSVSGTEFVEMFVGVGASRVRDLYDKAKRNYPCIIFIDEIDVVGAARDFGVVAQDERMQTFNQILIEIDSIDVSTHLVTVAATNRPDVLDPVLLRPGRFDRRVILDPPDENDREKIIKVHIRGKPVDPDVDIQKLASLMSGFVGADIENVVNEASIMAARRNKRSISQTEFEDATELMAEALETRNRERWGGNRE